MSNLNDLTTEAEALKRQAQEAFLKAGDELSEQAYYVRDFASNARFYTEDFIQSKPWQAVGIAAGIGFLFGVLVGSRR